MSGIRNRNKALFFGAPPGTPAAPSGVGVLWWDGTEFQFDAGGVVTALSWTRDPATAEVALRNQGDQVGIGDDPDSASFATKVLMRGQPTATSEAVATVIADGEQSVSVAHRAERITSAPLGAGDILIAYNAIPGGDAADDAASAVIGFNAGVAPTQSGGRNWGFVASSIYDVCAAQVDGDAVFTAINTLASGARVATLIGGQPLSSEAIPAGDAEVRGRDAAGSNTDGGNVIAQGGQATLGNNHGRVIMRPPGNLNGEDILLLENSVGGTVVAAFRLDGVSNKSQWEFNNVGGLELIEEGAATPIMQATGTTWGVHGSEAAQETVTGSRGANAALEDLLTKLANKGIIVDGTII